MYLIYREMYYLDLFFNCIIIYKAAITWIKKI